MASATPGKVAIAPVTFINIVKNAGNNGVPTAASIASTRTSEMRGMLMASPPHAPANAAPQAATSRAVIQASNMNGMLSPTA